MASCKEDGSEASVPKGILSKQEYAKVLTDLALAESAANLNVKNVRIEKLDSTYAFNPLKENKVSAGKFDSTALFYSQHPELYKDIYDEVLRSLTEMQEKRKAQVRDSIKK
jgi:hypothetical protein